MACSCGKISGMKKRHRVSGIGESMMPALLTGGGVIAAHEIKSMLPASLATSLGTNYSLILNGAGIAAGLFVPGMVKNPSTKKWLDPLMFGVGAQCLYSLFVEKVLGTNPPVINRTWATYALGKSRVAGRPQGFTYALGCVKNADGTMSYVPVLKPSGTTQNARTAANPDPAQVVSPSNVKPSMPARPAAKTVTTRATTQKAVVGGF
jgi:hypothetical protein